MIRKAVNVASVLIAGSAGADESNRICTFGFQERHKKVTNVDTQNVSDC